MKNREETLWSDFKHI